VTIRRRLPGERNQFGEDGPEDVKLLQAEARQLEGAGRPMEQSVTGLLFQERNRTRDRRRRAAKPVRRRSQRT
jgi:hypothetical protein